MVPAPLGGHVRLSGSALSSQKIRPRLCLGTCVGITDTGNNSGDVAVDPRVLSQLRSAELAFAVAVGFPVVEGGSVRGILAASVLSTPCGGSDAPATHTPRVRTDVALLHG
jgi:hypothetical protein